MRVGKREVSDSLRVRSWYRMVFYELEIGRFDRRLWPEEEIFEGGEMTSGGGSSGGNRGSSPGPMSHFLSEDHNRIDELLTRAIGADNQIDAEVYDGFRRALLRHIGMEEKIVLPAVERRQGAPLPVAAQLRLEHGAIASLLVLIPTPQIVSVIRRVLKQHNAREEGSDGVYLGGRKSLAEFGRRGAGSIAGCSGDPAQEMSDDTKSHRGSQTDADACWVRRNLAGLESKTSFPDVLASRRRQTQ